MDSIINKVEFLAKVSFTRRGVNHHHAKTTEDLELKLEDGWHFVFGGDSCDKGSPT